MTYLHQHGHVYVAIGKGGLLKVGRTISPAFRVYVLRCQFKKKGDVMREIWISDFNRVADYVERQLVKELRGMAKPHSGSEWFTGANFAGVACRIRQLIPQYQAKA